MLEKNQIGLTNKLKKETLRRIAVANCKYKITNTNQEFDSFADLLNNFVDKEIKDFQSLSDVVFSKYEKRDNTKKQIISLNKEYIPKKRVDDTNSAIYAFVDGEPHIGDSKVISISEWIDHPSSQINGNPIVTQMVKEDYIDSEVIRISKEQNITEDEARELVKKVLNNWKLIEEDSLIFHSLFTSSNIGNLAEFENQQELTKRISTQIVDKLHGRMQDFIRDLRFKHPDATILTNINLRTPIKDSEKELLGHIDYLVIDKRGTLHLY